MELQVWEVGEVVGENPAGVRIWSEATQYRVHLGASECMSDSGSPHMGIAQCNTTAANQAGLPSQENIFPGKSGNFLLKTKLLFIFFTTVGIKLLSLNLSLATAI